MVTQEVQKKEAIQTQSDRADQFAESYEVLTAEAYEDCFKYSRHRLHKLLEEYLPQDGAGLRLLDAGCGTGHHMADLRKRGYEVAGVDASKEMLEHARVNNPDSLILEADVDEIPLPDASFASFCQSKFCGICRVRRKPFPKCRACSNRAVFV